VVASPAQQTGQGLPCMEQGLPCMEQPSKQARVCPACMEQASPPGQPTRSVTAARMHMRTFAATPEQQRTEHGGAARPMGAARRCMTPHTWWFRSSVFWRRASASSLSAAFTRRSHSISADSPSATCAARALVCVCSCNTGGAGMCLYARPCLFEWVGRHACMTEGCGANAATQSSHAAAWVADSHTGKRCMALALEFAACVGRCTSSYSSGCAPLRPSNARAAQQAAQGTAGKVSLATTAARGSSQQQESQSSS